MILIQTSDFDNFHSLAQSIANTNELQAYIDRYEEKYIKLILGAVLGELYIVDKSNPTQDPIFVVIEDAFIMDENSSIRESKGLKDVLLSLIFYHYVFDTQTKHSQSGVTINQSEVSNTNSPENAARFGEQKWNDSLDSIESIQWYVTVFAPDDYPEYNGTQFKPRFSPLL